MIKSIDVAASLPDNRSPMVLGNDPTIAKHSAFSLLANSQPYGRVGTVRPGSTISNDMGRSCVHNLTPPAAPEGHPELALRLLDELEFPSELLGEGTSPALSDLNAVLAADYREGRGFPSVELAQELGRIIDRFVRPYSQIWGCWQDRQGPGQLRGVFHWGDVVVTAEPYLEGAGRSLWGFSTEKKVQGRRITVIFLNTAHERGAVATTIGHELGHHVYQAILGMSGDHPTIGRTFPQHLGDEHELFSDAVVAMSAYSQSATRAILGGGLTRSNVMARFRKAIASIDSHYRIDLDSDNLPPLWRLRYVTLTVHLFKLRCALLEEAGI
jgi:hypothetical protein